MKKLNLKFIVIPLLLFGIFACDKQETPEEPDFISANINGEYWEGESSLDDIRDNDSVWVGGFNEVEEWSYLLGIKIKFEGEGEYSLNQATHYMTVLERDMETSLHRLNENFPSQFTITEYDTKRNIIRGNFEMTLELKSRSDYPEPPEELVVKNGEFKITLDE